MKKNPWDNYDTDNLPALTTEQLKTFKTVDKATFNRLKPTEIRKIGRPPKKESEREKLVSIRFKPAVLQRIKSKARRAGFSSYQRYIKTILEREIS